LEELQIRKMKRKEKGKNQCSLAECLGVFLEEKKRKRTRERKINWHPLGAEGLEALEARGKAFKCFEKYQHHPLLTKIFFLTQFFFLKKCAPPLATPFPADTI